jgi:hypothetical protein
MAGEHDQRPTVACRDGWEARVPAELRSRKQWVVWRFEYREPGPNSKKGGKWTKVLYQPDSPVRKARTNDPKTWDTFEAAVKAWRAEPEVFSGVGYVFSESDPYSGIDLDNCLTGPGNSEVADWAAPILALLSGTYAEISPSGRGIKLWGRATLPGDGTKRIGYGETGEGAIELYSHTRFFTVTGNAWDESDGGAIRDIQDVATDLYHRVQDDAAGDREKRAKARAKAKKKATGAARGGGDGFFVDDAALLAHARSAKTGASFAALYDAGDLAGYESESEADLALCNMLAFWTGKDAGRIERLWMASALGQRDKVRERGDYRAWTVGKAVDDCNAVYDRNHAGGGVLPPWDGPEGEGPEDRPDDHSSFTNFTWEADGDDDAGEPKFKKVAIGLPVLLARLARLNPSWPKCVGQDRSLFIETPEYEPTYLDSPPKLFAWIGGMAKTDWARGSAMEPQDRFYEFTRMHADRYEAIETVPHFPPLPRIYYMHKPVEVGDGVTIERFINLFSPHTEMDRQLIRAMLLTLFWGGPPGSRPAFLVTGPDGDRGRGIGKSTLVDILAGVCGVKSIDVSPTDQITDVKTRLLSADGRHARVARLDNVKALRLSWADLEGLITARDISGRMLFKGEGSRPNTVMWCITLNGASLSTDMAQRCIILKLGRPTHRPEWEGEVKAFVEENRDALLADIRAALEAPTAPIDTRTRWSLWEREILGRCPMASLAQEVVVERQREVDDDDEDMLMVADYFRSVLKATNGLQINPETDSVLIPSAMAAAWYNVASNQDKPTNKASAALRELGIPELRKSDRGEFRGWLWKGRNFGTDSRSFDLSKNVLHPIAEADYG